MKKKTNKAIILVLFSLTIALSACGTKKIDGDYMGKINLLFTESTIILRFDGNNVVEVDDNGEESNQATYKIDDNELEITYPNEEIIKAELSKDKNSFTVKSADSGAEFLLKDTEFTKKEK